MTNKEIKESANKDKKKKIEENLPFCIKAHDAEHSRAHDNDEPCDDGRAGNLDEQ
jgi:hypothetical protein